MTRTDVHRPSAPEFDPAAYEFLGCYDLHEDPMLGGQRREYSARVAGLVRKGYTWTSAPYGSGKCSHCGANLRYVALMLHTATKTLLNVGETCLDNRFSVTKGEFRAAQKRAAELRAQHARLAAWERLCADLPELVWASYAENIAVSGAESETVEGHYARPAYRRIKPGTRWDERHGKGWACTTLADIARKARQYGDLSEKQAALVVRLVRELETAEDDRAAKDAARAAELSARANAYQGTVGKRDEWTGTVRDLFGFEGAYGWTTVVVIDTPAGALKWFSSRGVDANEGDTVHVRATVKKHEERDGERFTVITRAALSAA